MLRHWSVSFPPKAGKDRTQYRSSHCTCSVKKVFLEMSQNSEGNTCARDSGTGVSSEFCKISKYTFFKGDLRTTASDSRFIQLKIMTF